MDKRGFEMSFSFIFSVIIIAAIVFVAFYTIGKFFGVKSCTEQALFYEDFQEEVDRAWNSEIVSNTFNGRIPSGIEKVCLGDLNVSDNSREYRDLSRYRYSGGNTFLWPPEKACDDLVANEIEHLGFAYNGIMCFEVVNGRVSIPLEKGSFDSVVRVKAISSTGAN